MIFPVRRLSLLFPLVVTVASVFSGNGASAQIIPWSTPPALEDGKKILRRVHPREAARIDEAILRRRADFADHAAPVEAAVKSALPTPGFVNSVEWAELQPLPSGSVLLSSFDSTAGSGSVRAGTSWVGHVTQNSGSITVGSGAGDDNGWSASGLSLNATGMNFLTITAQRETGNLAPSIFIQLEDRALRTQIFSVSTALFAVGVPTVVHIPITSWTINFGSNDIASWSIGGGGLGTVPLRLTFDEVSFGVTAIPEPSTVALLAGFTAFCITVAYRRRAARR